MIARRLIPQLRSRRAPGLLRSLVLGMLCAAFVATPRASSQPAAAVAPTPHQDSPALRVTEVLSIGMTVGDLDRAVAFYSEALGFEKVAEREVAG